MTIRSLFPRGFIEWILFAVIAYAYANAMIEVLLHAEVIPAARTKMGWSVVERIMAFPAFYLGVEPLTGLIINTVFWGVAAAKILASIWRKRPIKKRA